MNKALLMLLVLGLSACSSSLAPAVMPQPSPDRTMLTPTSGSAIIDIQLNYWTLTLTGEVRENNIPVLSPDLGGHIFAGYAGRLQYYNNQVWALGKDDARWWVWDGKRFVVGD